MFGDVFTLLGIMGVLLVLDWRLALVTFAVLPLICVVTQWFRRNVRESYRDGPHVDRAHQRVPAGEHDRDVDGAAVPAARGATSRPSTRSTARTATRTSTRSSTTPSSIRRSNSSARWRSHSFSGSAVLDVLSGRSPRRARGVRAVPATLLPAHQRHVGEVQRPAGGDGVVRTDLHACSTRRPPTSVRRADAAAAATAEGHIVFDDVWFPYRRRELGWVSGTSHSRSARPARRHRRRHGRPERRR